MTEMTEPLVVTISHRLGKVEALRRVKNGLAAIPPSLGPAFRIVEQAWTEDVLDFRVSVFASMVLGTIRIAEDHVRLRVTLPWLLARLAAKAQALIQKEGRLMLDNK